MLWENCYLLCRREKNSQMLLGRRVTLNFEADTNFKKNRYCVYPESYSFAVHLNEKIRNHLRETVTNSAKIH